MIQSKTFFAAATFGLGLTVAALSLAGFGASARADAGAELAAGRIAAAFAAAPVTAPDPALQAAAARTGKGDLLLSPNCDAQSWPNLSAGCVASGHGAAIRPARNVTVGYQTDVSTIVLVRMPAPQLASR